VSPPVGPTGLRGACSGDDENLSWHAGLSGSWSGTHLVFDGNSDIYFDKYAITGSFEGRMGDRWTLGGAIGTTVEGWIDQQGAISSVGPGPLAAFTASFRPVDEGDVRPFVLVTGSLAGSVSWVETPGGVPSSTLSAFDLRLGVVAGKTIANVFTPYLVARTFGGPVFWTVGGNTRTGTDASHYQLGAGFSLHVGRVDLVFEGVPLGELGLTAGASVAF
jgi:hypothetical protein